MESRLTWHPIYTTEYIYYILMHFTFGKLDYAFIAQNNYPH